MPRILEAVIFDLDGTITVPALDFPRIKAEMGLPQERPILESLDELATHARPAAEGVLHRFELEAAEKSQLNPGVVGVLERLGEMGLKTGVLTRNSRNSVEIVCRRHGLHFDAVVTREDSVPKPDPDGVLLAAGRLGVEAKKCVMVGDYEFDITAGRAAGAVTVLYSPDGRSYKTVPDFTVRSMEELVAVLKALLERPV